MASERRSTNVGVSALVFFLGVMCFSPICFHSTAAAVFTHFYFFIHTNPDSGKEMYAQYCAGCHGSDGHGLGSAAQYCTVPPSNLALLARKNHGSFPAKRVSQVLHSGTGKTPQGQGYMPVWEPLLKTMNEDEPATTETRIVNLTEYVRTLQEHPETPHKKHAAPSST